MLKCVVGLFLVVYAAQVFADDATKVELAVGGGIGGAVGAVVGNELGDRKGAIVGSALGAAIGTPIVTKDKKPKVKSTPRVAVDIAIESTDHRRGRHCPPGQAKKGRC